MSSYERNENIKTFEIGQVADPKIATAIFGSFLRKAPTRKYKETNHNTNHQRTQGNNKCDSDGNNTDFSS